MSIRHLELVLKQIPVSPADTQRIYVCTRSLHHTPEISELKFIIEEMNAQLDRDILKIDEANTARYTPNPELLHPLPSAKVADLKKEEGA